MMAVALLAGIALVIFGLAPTGAQEPRPAQVPTDAIARTLDLLGLDGRRSDPVAVPSAGRQVPIPYDIDAGVWQVTIEGIHVEVAGTVNEHVKTMDVFFDYRGRLLQAVSRWPAGHPQIPFPSPGRYELSLRQMSEEYVGLPGAAPIVSLEEAVSRSLGAGEAKQIVAYYATLARSTWTEPRDVWVVHAWGMRPWMPTGGYGHMVPENARNHLRSIIDARTGEGYGADTTPQPER